MPQLIRTTNDVIINSLYLLGELGVGEEPDAFMLTTGLDLINELLDKFSSDSIYVPFLTEINFNFVPGQDTYSISDMVTADINADRIIDLSFANYVIIPESAEPVVYPMQIISKANYYNVVRQQNLNTRPAFIFLNKQALESFVTIYPSPDQPYPCILQCKVMINSLSADQDLTSLPPFYYGFLKYALAQKFLGYYPSGNWTAVHQKEYDDYYDILKNVNETDLTIRPSMTLTQPVPFYWQNIFSY